MQYMLLIYVNEGGWAELSRAEQEQWMGAYKAYTEALEKAGVLSASNGLQPTSTATTVRVADGKTAGARRALRRHQGAARRLST